MLPLLLLQILERQLLLIQPHHHSTVLLHVNMLPLFTLLLKLYRLLLFSVRYQHPQSLHSLLLPLLKLVRFNTTTSSFFFSDDSLLCTEIISTTVYYKVNAQAQSATPSGGAGASTVTTAAPDITQTFANTVYETDYTTIAGLTFTSTTIVPGTTQVYTSNGIVGKFFSTYSVSKKRTKVSNTLKLLPLYNLVLPRL